MGIYVYSLDMWFFVIKDYMLIYWDFRIRNVKLEDVGVYFCVVSFGEGWEKYRRFIKFNVKGW